MALSFLNSIIQRAVSTLQQATSNAAFATVSAVNRTSFQLSSISFKVDNVNRTIFNQISSLSRIITSKISNSAFAVINRTNSLFGALSGQISQTLKQVVNSQRIIAAQTQNIIRQASQGIIKNTAISTQQIFNKVDSSTIRLEKRINKLDATISQRLSQINTEVIIDVESIKKAILINGQVISQAIIEQTRVLDVQRSSGIVDTTLAFINQVNRVLDRGQQNLEIFSDTVLAALRDVAPKIGAGFLDQVIPEGSILDDIMNLGFDGWLKKTIDSLLTHWGVAIDVSDILIDIYEKILRGEYETSAELQKDVSRLIEDVGVLKAIFLGGIFLPFLFSALVSVSSPFVQNLTNLSIESARPNLLPASTSLDAFTKQLISKTDTKLFLQRLGFDDDDIEVLIETSFATIDPNRLRDLFLRGFMDKAEHDRSLKRLGIRDSDIPNITDLYSIIPPIQDLIRFAVREAFSPEIARRFGQFEDFPEAVVEPASKQGLSRDWVEKYWASHWSLPSALQGFEMLHRRVIDESDLDLLLRALDVMPFWRDRLKEISFRPFTRVDVRRMHKLGVLDEEGVFSAYLDIGYDNNKARAMTEFTLLYNSRTDETGKDTIQVEARKQIEVAYSKGLIDNVIAVEQLTNLGHTVEDAETLLELSSLNVELEARRFTLEDNYKRIEKIAISGYGRRTIPRNEAIELLQITGYTISEAESELDFVDTERTIQLKQFISDSIKELYTEFVISNADAVSVLSSNGFEIEEIEMLLEEFNIVREFRTRLPSKADFETWFKMDLISVDELADGLRGIRYPEKFVSLFVQENLQRLQR